MNRYQRRALVGSRGCCLQRDSQSTICERRLPTGVTTATTRTQTARNYLRWSSRNVHRPTFMRTSCGVSKILLLACYVVSPGNNTSARRDIPGDFNLHQPRCEKRRFRRQHLFAASTENCKACPLECDGHHRCLPVLLFIRIRPTQKETAGGKTQRHISRVRAQNVLKRAQCQQYNLLVVRNWSK